MCVCGLLWRSRKDPAVRLCFGQGRAVGNVPARPGGPEPEAFTGIKAKARGGGGGESRKKEIEKTRERKAIHTHT